MQKIVSEKILERGVKEGAMVMVGIVNHEGKQYYIVNDLLKKVTCHCLVK